MIIKTRILCPVQLVPGRGALLFGDGVWLEVRFQFSPGSLAQCPTLETYVVLRLTSFPHDLNT